LLPGRITDASVLARAGDGVVTVLLAHADLAPALEVNDVVTDAHGNVFTADNAIMGAKPESVYCQVREVVAGSGAIRIVAGFVPRSHAPTRTAAQRLALNGCDRLAVDRDDQIYLVSAPSPGLKYSRVYRIDARTGSVRVIGGCGHCRFIPYSGRPATQSSISDVGDLAVDRRGDLLLAMTELGSIWEIDPGGVMRLVAANVCSGIDHMVGSSCPDLLAPANDGSIFFVDRQFGNVARLTLHPFHVAIVAGGGTCRRETRACQDVSNARMAHLDGPQDIEVDKGGDLYVADGPYLREVDLRSGTIQNVMGDGTLPAPNEVMALRRGDQFDADRTAIDCEGVAVGPSGSVYVAGGDAYSLFSVR
jgi:hypothetical protein